ncbi:hypothetical protein PHABIO_353 [Pseudomonas phage Phabio]|uniref:Uncharacterized protein n=1 Tax=Pseudomonas phage Phabio TaxID=2006668 RepID=A0A1Y0SWM3_9CAUD|nr:hypothetical protein MZD05_gp353 [Pseudomonas phage Phabio]ARV76984.1 hypothetical protein PHABIO_353 [Pseudomonas phage Phabio]
MKEEYEGLDIGCEEINLGFMTATKEWT